MPMNELFLILLAVVLLPIFVFVVNKETKETEFAKMSSFELFIAIVGGAIIFFGMGVWFN